MQVDFFVKLNKFKVGRLKTPEDFADRFHFQITPIVLLIFLSLIGIRQYIFIPIQCWVPREWSRAWEEFAENYCWVQDTYFAKVVEGPPRAQHERANNSISYYQWVPFILAAKAFFSYIPHLIWLFLSRLSGSDLGHLIKFAEEAATIDEDKKKHYLLYLAREILAMNKLRRQRQQRIPLRRYFSYFESASMLVLAYFVIKCLYIGIAIGQLFLMQKFLGMGSIFYGLNLLFEGPYMRPWSDTGIFPRVTWCDLPRREFTNQFTHSMMCVMPVNMLNEKIYIFLWYWFMVGIALTLWSLAFWCYRVLLADSPQVLVRKTLKMYKRFGETAHNDQEVNHFVQHVLDTDGLFVFCMILDNIGEVASLDLLMLMMDEFKKENAKKSEKLEKMEINSVDLSKRIDYV